jgi:UDP-glucose 4-epimerase
LSILEACRKWNPDIKIVFASTRQIYGKPEYLPVDERHLVRPVDVNGINKMSGEWYHILYNNVYGVRACALRLTNTYGPRMRVKDARQTFLGIWIRLLLEGSPFEVWDGDQLRDFTYVDDAVNAFLATAESEETSGEVFDVGGDQHVSLRELADMVVKVAGCGEYSMKSYPLDRKRIDVGDYYADYSRLETVVGWRPQIAVVEGLIHTINFYRKHLENYV